jgi:hypothetical protein
MRQTARAAAGAAAGGLALAAAGCGGSSPAVQRSLDAFLTGTPQGRAWAKRFPHTPGSIPCTAVDPTLHRRVPATCSTDVALGANDRVVVTFTQSWSHGSRARTWFVFLRRDGALVSVKREGTPG